MGTFVEVCSGAGETDDVVVFLSSKLVHVARLTRRSNQTLP